MDIRGNFIEAFFYVFFSRLFPPLVSLCIFFQFFLIKWTIFYLFSGFSFHLLSIGFALLFICVKVRKRRNTNHFRRVGRPESPENREKCNSVEKKLPKCLQVQKKSLPLHSLLGTRHNNNETTTKLKFQCKVSKGRLAQLVQSICLTSRGSAVRIRQRPLQKMAR